MKKLEDPCSHQRENSQPTSSWAASWSTLGQHRVHNKTQIPASSWVSDIWLSHWSHWSSERIRMCKRREGQDFSGIWGQVEAEDRRQIDTNQLMVQSWWLTVCKHDMSSLVALEINLVTFFFHTLISFTLFQLSLGLVAGLWSTLAWSCVLCYVLNLMFVPSHPLYSFQ